MTSTETDLRGWVPTTRELLIDGSLVPGEGPVVEAVNPATEQGTATVPTASLTQVDEAVAAARPALPASRAGTHDALVDARYTLARWQLMEAARR